MQNRIYSGVQQGEDLLNRHQARTQMLTLTKMDNYSMRTWQTRSRKHSGRRGQRWWTEIGRSRILQRMILLHRQGSRSNRHSTRTKVQRPRRIAQTRL
jgi:hypothetical protein